MLGIKLQIMIWLLGSTLKMSLENKMLIYKAMMKPVWTFGIQLWEQAAVTNIVILQRFQNKILRTITNASWYVTNNQLHNDLDMLSVEEEIKRNSSNYNDRLKHHLNQLARDLTSTTKGYRDVIQRFQIQCQQHFECNDIFLFIYVFSYISFF